jgi:hypothetical protein
MTCSENHLGKLPRWQVFVLVDYEVHGTAGVPFVNGKVRSERLRNQHGMTVTCMS